MPDSESHEQRSVWDEIAARRPSVADLDYRGSELLGRAQLVQQFGWDNYRHTWSSGEVAGTALLLGDLEALAATHDTEHTALETWATSLWGIDGGRRDTDNGLERTRAWFYALRQQLTDPPAKGHHDD